MAGTDAEPLAREPITRREAAVSSIGVVGGQAAPMRSDAGLRERKRQHTRQLLSHTAMEMFLQRGFDHVTVAEVAQACGMSLKTVYNYFPAKEALVLDKYDQLADSVHAATTSKKSPVQAMLEMLDTRMHHRIISLGNQRDDAAGIESIRRFLDLIEDTPSLRAYHLHCTDRLIDVAATGLAEAASLPAHAPEVQATAYALIALFHIQGKAIRHHAASTSSYQCLVDLVTTDLHRAAQLTENGLQNRWTPT